MLRKVLLVYCCCCTHFMVIVRAMARVGVALLDHVTPIAQEKDLRLIGDTGSNEEWPSRGEGRRWSNHALSFKRGVFRVCLLMVFLCVVACVCVRCVSHCVGPCTMLARGEVRINHYVGACAAVKFVTLHLHVCGSHQFASAGGARDLAREARSSIPTVQGINHIAQSKQGYCVGPHRPWETSWPHSGDSLRRLSQNICISRCQLGGSTQLGRCGYSATSEARLPFSQLSEDDDSVSHDTRSTQEISCESTEECRAFFFRSNFRGNVSFESVLSCWR